MHGGLAGLLFLVKAQREGTAQKEKMYKKMKKERGIY